MVLEVDSPVPVGELCQFMIGFVSWDIQGENGLAGNLRVFNAVLTAWEKNPMVHTQFELSE